MSGQYGRRKAPIVIVPTEDVLSVELLLMEDWNLLRLIPKIDKVENVLPWLACRGLINNHVECGRCKHPCSLVKFRESKDQKQWKCHDCGWSKSVRDGSFFSASQFSFETIIMIMYLLLSEMPIQSICSEMNITPVLAIKWQKKIQTVYTDVLNKLGSSGENMGIRKKNRAQLAWGELPKERTLFFLFAKVHQGAIPMQYCHLRQFVAQSQYGHKR